MRRRKPTTKYLCATASIWNTCEEIVANRYVALVMLFKLNLEGK